MRRVSARTSLLTRPFRSVVVTAVVMASVALFLDLASALGPAAPPRLVTAGAT